MYVLKSFRFKGFIIIFVNMQYTGVVTHEDHYLKANL
jgi:hypothetical protein